MAASDKENQDIVRQERSISTQDADTLGAPNSVPPTRRRFTVWSIVDAALLVAVLGILVVVVLQIGSRLVGRSLSGTEELTRFLFIWTTFLGMASGFRTADHARITFLLRWLPSVARRFSIHLYAAVGILFFAIIAYYGAALSLQQYRNGETSPILQVGMFLVTLPVTVSAILAIVAQIQTVYFEPTVRRGLEHAEEVSE